MQIGAQLPDDFARIVECCKDFKSIEVIPNKILVQKALGWYDPHRPHWSSQHDEDLEDALMIVYPESYGIARRLSHLGTEIQMYPKNYPSKKHRGRNFRITELRAERTVDYVAVGDEA